MSTKITVNKGIRGNMAENIIEVNGTPYQLSTSKRYSGRIVCVAMSCQKVYDNGNILFSSDAEKIILCQEDKGTRATAKNIANVQKKGIELFNRMAANSQVGSTESA